MPPSTHAASDSAGESSPLAFLRRMRRHHQGVLRFDEDDVIVVRFVLQPASGRPVLPVPARVQGAKDCVLCLPDDALDNPECLQLTGDVVAVDPLREAACDRWVASFGKAPTATWGVLAVSSAKRLDAVLDGGLVCLPNPLAREEGSLCKLCNSNPAGLARACARQLGLKTSLQTGLQMGVQSTAVPFAVGVDALGVDVRLSFGVARLEFEEPVVNAAEAAAAIGKLVG